MSMKNVHSSLRQVLEVLNHIGKEQDRGPPYVLTVIYRPLSFYAPYSPAANLDILRIALLTLVRKYI